jgi:purine-nucleoside phosphorylase
MAESGPNAGEDPVAAAVALLRPLLPEGIEWALVLGTGLGDLAAAVESPVTLAYRDIPGFPRAGVSGHAGRLVLGRLEGRRVAVLQGRAHYYESGDAAVMRHPIETLARLGARGVILTNAAGSLQEEVGPGSIAMIGDHINLSGANPLIGDRDERRFVSMTDAYAPALRAKFRNAAGRADVRLHEGVYVWTSGPSFETPAEIRMMQILGGSLVGMSTVPEVILARRFGLEVAAFSIVTNLGAGIADASPSHAETKEVAAVGAGALRKLLIAFLKGDPDV